MFKFKPHFPEKWVPLLIAGGGGGGSGKSNPDFKYSKSKLVFTGICFSPICLVSLLFVLFSNKCDYREHKTLVLYNLLIFIITYMTFCFFFTKFRSTWPRFRPLQCRQRWKWRWFRWRMESFSNCNSFQSSSRSKSNGKIIIVGWRRRSTL